MSRLTNQYCNNYDDFVFSLRNSLTTQSELNNGIYRRLKQLEDVEEELGIDLITLFKALKNGAWFINNKKAIYVENLCLCYCRNDKKVLQIQFRVVNIGYLVKDYGKTWALTKEELEDDQ